MGVELLTEHVHSACNIMQSTKKDNNQMFQAEWGGFVTEKTDSRSFFPWNEGGTVTFEGFFPLAGLICFL